MFYEKDLTKSRDAEPNPNPEPEPQGTAKFVWTRTRTRNREIGLAGPEPELGTAKFSLSPKNFSVTQNHELQNLNHAKVLKKLK